MDTELESIQEPENWLGGGRTKRRKGSANRTSHVWDTRRRPPAREFSSVGAQPAVAPHSPCVHRGWNRPRFQAARVYRWCRPPTWGIAITFPSEGCSTRRGTGAFRSSER